MGYISAVTAVAEVPKKRKKEPEEIEVISLSDSEEEPTPKRVTPEVNGGGNGSAEETDNGKEPVGGKDGGNHWPIFAKKSPRAPKTSQGKTEEDADDFTLGSREFDRLSM